MLQCKIRGASIHGPGFPDNRFDANPVRLSMNEQELLRALIAGPVSGDALARRHGLSRAAVWKKVEALREAGVEIAASAGRGYALAQPLDLLDAVAIRGALAPEAALQLATLEVAWSVDSSNAELLRRGAPASGVDVLLVERQTAGRGRRGRQWASPLAANLYLSLGRRFSGGLARLGGLSLAAGVAVAEALRASGAEAVGLKWPNDLVAAGRKLGGLLVEGSGEAAGAASAVVGIGLNVRMPSAQAWQIEQPWTDLAALTREPPSRNALVVQLLDHLLPALALFDREGLAPFLPRYAAHDVLRGQPLVVLAGDGSRLPGIGLGVAADGALRVDAAGVEHQLHAGEVSVRRA